MGRCNLCLREVDKLTFEHIPPRSAFNKLPSKVIKGEQLFKKDGKPWDFEGVRYESMQKGMGLQVLCSDCNNNTGAWYGAEYSKFTSALHRLLSEEGNMDKRFLHFMIEGIYPSRIVKQMISNLCCINDVDDEDFNELREFVINRDRVGIDKSKYMITTYIIKDGQPKYCPKTALLDLKNNDPMNNVVLSELCYYPIGFSLYIGNTQKERTVGAEITDFTDYEFNEKGNIEMRLPICESNSYFPNDFRTKEEIEETIKLSEINI